jgi:hypothetical protein
MNALLEETGDSNVERSRTAGENVDPQFVMESVVHVSASPRRADF